MVREPDATMQATPQDIQLMSKRRVLSFKPQLRLEWRGQDGQNETEQSDHSASLGDSITSSTRIRFSVHTPISRSHFGNRSWKAPAGGRFSSRVGALPAAAKIFKKVLKPPNLKGHLAGRKKPNK